MKKPKKPKEKLKEKVKVSTAQLIEEIIKAEGILNAIGDGISILDRTFMILYENQIHRDMLGDNVGKYCYRAYRQREGICSGCPVALIFKDGEIHTVQRKIKSDEGIKYLEITASPLRDSEGNIIAGIEVVRDITERKQIETELQLSEEKYRMTVDFLNDALHVTDENLNIVLVNKKLLEWHKVFGLGTDVIGKNVFEIYPFLLSKVQEEYKDVIKAGKSIKTEESTLIDGGVVITETIKIPIFEENKVTKIITIMHDITKRKKTEQELRKKVKELEDFYDMAVGRELRMKQLKDENKELREELKRYKKTINN